MPIALVLITLGSMFVYSAVTDVSLVDMFTGATAGIKRFSPSNAIPETAVGEPPAGAPSNLPGLGGVRFKGPYAAQLEALAQKAVTDYDLTIVQICRPIDAGYGAPNSLHKQCRAFDAIGKTADKVAFARYVKASEPWVDEVFCDQAGMIAPGYEHTTHMHVGA